MKLASGIEPIVVVALVVLVAFIVLACATYLARRIVKRYSQCWQPDQTQNGIRVGAPKVYDNRSLTLMLEELQNQLKALESIDGGTLKNSLGTMQNERNTSTDTSVGLAFLAAPLATGQAASDAVAPPRVPASGAADKQTVVPQALSERAADLLDDQINLSYQIFNLRLLLERAISDRLTNDLRPRIQAVVALPISIDTPAFAVGCAATVEVRFSVRGSSSGPSLVALFPQEETYNTLSVDRRGTRGDVSAGSGGASASAGFSRGRDASSIRRQADIVAVERQPNEVKTKPVVKGATSDAARIASDAVRKTQAGQLTVAWQFRPSAGERSVNSGLRQVMAVLALPSSGESTTDVKVEVEVRSLWQTWNAKTSTSANGAGWRAIFTDRPARYDFGSHGHVSVPLASVLDDTLKPQINSIDWYRIGPSGACVTVNGKNFFTGTTAVMGDKIVDAGSGLTVKSEQTIQIIVPISALLDDALLNGRYGPSRIMALPPENVPPLEIANVWITPKPGNQSYELALDLQARDHERLDWALFRTLPTPIFAINKNVMPGELHYDAPGTTDKDGYRVTARAILAPEALSGRSLLISVRWPFFGSAWSLQHQTYNSAAPLSVMRTETDGDVALLIFGRDFDTDVRVIVDKVYKIADGNELNWAAPGSAVNDVIVLKLARDTIDKHHEMLVLQDGRATVSVAIPPAKDSAPPSLDLSQEPHLLTAKAACSVDFPGSGLETIHRVRLSEREQQFAVYHQGTSIKVMIDGESIATAGKHEIEFETKAGRRLKAPVFVIAAANGAAADGAAADGAAAHD